MYIAKLKDGPKIAKETSSMILERVFEMVWWRGENGITSKRIFLMLRCFSPLRILASPLFEETIGALLFSFLLCFFYAASLENLGVLMIFEEKNTSSKTSFQMAWDGMAWSWLWIYWRWMNIPKWSYARQYR
jgi:hypothetical protein